MDDTMGILIDTNVIVSFLIETEKNHNRAIKLFENLLDNSYGSLFVTDYIVDEVITLMFSRFKRKDLVKDAYAFLSEKSGIFNIIYTEKPLAEDSWKLWTKYAEYPKRPLSFTDASLLAIAQEFKIDYIASFDEEFKGLISVLQ